MSFKVFDGCEFCRQPFFLAATVWIAAMVGACDARPQKYHEFLRRPLPQRHEEFRTLPASDQVSIYLEAMKREPPDVGYKWDIAETQGVTAIPVIVRKLREQKDEYARCDLLDVLALIVEKRGLGLDADTVATARNVAEGITNAGFRRRADKALTTIAGSRSTEQR